MKSIQAIAAKILSSEALKRQAAVWRLQNKTIVFTNGVFDILHQGHFASLCEAASFGHILVVGLNSDASVKRLKGETRPVNNEKARALLLAGFLMTDVVVIFEEDTPLALIKLLMPDVLVKGGDYSVDQIAGASEVMAAGGQVKIAAIIEGVSTTVIIDKMRQITD